ncbi:GerAB/ArcD/ProY family transporter [Oceanobacillus polygoni]|uniref:Spore germination protein (Amino acid permease) n=1 Tax=Oceanobacillus polygoni TaxID=1235259 RepID=A0A9X0YSW0_9BACI|nr:GerAB/ArcD/ProY family transporter [Oceanobacillus polygoni]MBP2076715.1 spore germination protein (amino acid permease) [Oceanobacillus polygoni]
MEINVNVKSNLRIQAFYLFFIIVSMQIGVGILGVPRLIFSEAKQDSWISILMATVYIIIVLFVMLLTLKQYDNADIHGIHLDVFGKWLGKLFSTVYILYFAIALYSVLITYIEIVKVFVFPEVSNFVMGLILICLTIYGVLGGLRVIIGVSFVFGVLANWILFLLIHPALQIDLAHYLPLFQASFVDLLKGAMASSYTFMGFEILFLVYPFIHNKNKVSISSILAVTWSSLLVLAATMLAIGFFAAAQLERREWAVLVLFKTQSFPFVERFDYIVVAELMMVVAPSLLFLMWGLTYSIKRVYKVQQKTTLYITSALFLIGTFFFEKHFETQQVINFANQFGLWLIYVYPFVLLPFVLLKKRLNKRKGARSS